MTLFEFVILAAEEEPEGIDLVLPEMKELYAGIIAFGIVFSFIRFLAWPRMIKPTLEGRQEAIVGQLREAENVKSEAESLLSDYQAQVAGAKDEATLDSPVWPTPPGCERHYPKTPGLRN